MREFEIKILRQHWIKDDGKDDPEDLCSHGQVFVRIGEEIIVDSSTKGWTLSATGLFLLRTLDHDHKVGDFSTQLVPCCGHVLIPPKEGSNEVIILGCPNGYDWGVTHAGDEVIFQSQKGSTGKLPFHQYEDQILNFTDKVEEFYYDHEPKVIPDNEEYRAGYYQFWKEWKTLKKQHVASVNF